MNRVSVFATPLDIRFVHAARKPSHAPFRKAMQLMGLNEGQTIVVGDQLLTDVLGGNRLGLYTVLVLPIALGDEGWRTRFNRRVERIAIGRLRKMGKWLEEEKKK